MFEIRRINLDTDLNDSERLSAFMIGGDNPPWSFASIAKVKPLSSGHHWDFEKVSVTRRCQLHRGISQGKLSLGTLKSVRCKELSVVKDIRHREGLLYLTP